MPILNRRVPKSPRHLALRHAKKLFGTPRAFAFGEAGAQGAGDEDEPLLPGEERLYSFYVPGLVAGIYDITTEQTVQLSGSSSEKPLRLTGKQSFEVVAPQFALPAGAVHSQYPPDGHADLVETLPHLILTDPHLPWERIATSTEQPDHAFNRIPWLALLTFTPEELQLPTGSPLAAKQTETMSVSMTLAELGKVPVTLQIPKQIRDDNADTVADFIFVQPDLFNELTKEYDTEALKEGPQKTCSVSRYKWLAHVRNINTTGMADSGEFEAEEGEFGVIVGHRAGPMDNEIAKPIIAHLVSIEYLANISWPVPADKLVALTSLYSWTYMSLPADSFSVGEAMEHLGNTLDMLRPPQITIDRLMQNADTKWLAQRLNDGYTLAKYRTSTGEISAALYRGPFAPTTVTHKLQPMSFFGTELQVLDKQTGLMDITYSVAWHVGRTLALGDQAFTAALSRLRTAIYREGLKLAQKQALKAESKDAVVELRDALSNLSQGLTALNNISTSTDRNAPGPAVRWARDAAEPLDVSFGSLLVASRFRSAADTVMSKFSLSQDGNIYNEINAHTFPDWPIVLSWVLDRMYLGNLPSHYIIPDPSHLPRESLRFFHIDNNWIEALIDGGLAVANQVEKDDDKIRACIKMAISTYLQTKLGEGEDAYLPQVPTHGFLMRSELITKYPDLILEAPFTATNKEDLQKKPAAILRQENLDSTVLLALFDREPGSDDFQQLIFRQPPHQQSFAAAFRLTPEYINLRFKRVYTRPSKDTPEERKLTLEPSPNPIPATNPSVPFIWGSNNSIRTLKFPDYATLAYNTLTEQMGKDFDKEAPTSALVGIELNNPMLFLEIRKTKRPPKEPSTEGLRTLLMSSPTTPPVLPAARSLRLIRARDMFDLTAPLSALISLPRTTDEPAPPPPPRLLPTITEAEFLQITSPDQPSGDESLSRRFTSFAGGPAGFPKIAYSCYGFGTFARTSKTVPMHPNPPPLRQDLIFSILIDPTSVFDFHLHEIQIEVRLGPMTGARKTLASKYDGPGARMLSNLRFNVIPVTAPDGNLLIRLLPRSTLGIGVPMTFVTELSFVLSGVVVNRYEDAKLDKDGQYKTYTIVTEDYGDRGKKKLSDETSDDPFVIVVRKPTGNEYDID